MVRYQAGRWNRIGTDQQPLRLRPDRKNRMVLVMLPVPDVDKNFRPPAPPSLPIARGWVLGGHSPILSCVDSLDFLAGNPSKLAGNNAIWRENTACLTEEIVVSH